MTDDTAPRRHAVDPPVQGMVDWNCPVEVAIAPITGKWKIVILWHLSATGPVLRFSEINRLIPGIKSRMLARQLRELEADGLIWRDVYPVSPPRVEYGLTPRGDSLRQVLDAMCLWGKANGWTQPPDAV